MIVICAAAASAGAQAARIPRMPDGKPNLTGLWQAIANGSNITFPDGKKLFLGSSGTGAPFDPEKK